MERVATKTEIKEVRTKEVAVAKKAVVAVEVERKVCFFKIISLEYLF